jgi:hypothetical protein
LRYAAFEIGTRGGGIFRCLSKGGGS